MKLLEKFYLFIYLFPEKKWESKEEILGESQKELLEVSCNKFLEEYRKEILEES